jgi:hypothetical protein
MMAKQYENRLETDSVNSSKADARKRKRKTKSLYNEKTFCTKR